MKKFNQKKECIKALLKSMAITVFLIVPMTLGLTGCSQAERASYNVSKQADNFNVLRQLTVINNMSNDVVYTMTGKFSIEVDETENQLEVIVENEDGSYSKHFVGLNNMTTYTVADLDANYVSRYKFTVNYNPNMWMPVEFDVVE